MTEEVRNKILSMDVPQKLKELCTRKAFRVISTTTELKPRNSNLLYLDATEVRVDVEIGGIYIRAQDLYCTVSKRNSSFYYCFEFKIGENDWELLYEDSDRLGPAFGDVESLKKSLGVVMDSYALSEFIIHTLCGISISLELLEEHFFSSQ